MTGLEISITVLWLLAQTETTVSYSNNEVPDTCGNVELRKAAVDDLLRSKGCEDYECGKLFLSDCDKHA